MNDFDTSFAEDLGPERPFRPDPENWGRIARRLDATPPAAAPGRVFRWPFWLAGAGVLAVFWLGWTTWQTTAALRDLQAEVARLRTETAQKAAAAAAMPSPENAGNFGVEKTRGDFSGQNSPTTPAPTAAEKPPPAAAQFFGLEKTPGFVGGQNSPAAPAPAAAEKPSPAAAQFFGLKKTPGFVGGQNSPATPAPAAAETRNGAAAQFFGLEKTPGFAEAQNPATAARDLSTFKMLTNLEAPALLPARSLSFPKIAAQKIDVQQIVHSPTPPPPSVKLRRARRFALGPVVRFSVGDAGREADARLCAAGLGLEFSPGPRLRLLAEAGLGEAVLGYGDDADFGRLPAPVPAPPAVGFAFAGLLAKRPGLDFGLGLRWHFRPEKRLQPFAALGWSGFWGRTARFDFLFKNEQSGDKIRLEGATFPRDGKPLEHFLRPGIGLSGRFGGRFGWSAECFGEIGRTGAGHRRDDLRTGLKINLLYGLR